MPPFLCANNLCGLADYGDAGIMIVPTLCQGASFIEVLLHLFWRIAVSPQHKLRLLLLIQELYQNLDDRGALTEWISLA